jgi:hypothetical protein
MNIRVDDIDLEWGETLTANRQIQTVMVRAAARGTFYTQNMECDFELPLNKDEEEHLRAILESVKERLPQQFTQQGW